MKIQRGATIIFDGNPVDLFRYPVEAYSLMENEARPKESDAYPVYKRILEHNQAGSLDKFFEK